MCDTCGSQTHIEQFETNRRRALALGLGFIGAFSAPFGALAADDSKPPRRPENVKAPRAKMCAAMSRS
jgi:hypothetical protein